MGTHSRFAVNQSFYKCSLDIINFQCVAYSQYGGFMEKKVVNVIGETGNCVAASLPLALAMAHNSGKIKRGDLLFLTGTGAGLSIAQVLLIF